jgi:hypothetical protein
MIRICSLAAVTAASLSIAVSSLDSIFGGLAFLALGVTGFGLVVALCSVLKREN